MQAKSNNNAYTRNAKYTFPLCLLILYSHVFGAPAIVTSAAISPWKTRGSFVAGTNHRVKPDSSAAAAAPSPSTTRIVQDTHIYLDIVTAVVSETPRINLTLWLRLSPQLASRVQPNCTELHIISEGQDYMHHYPPALITALLSNV